MSLYVIFCFLYVTINICICIYIYIHRWMIHGKRAMDISHFDMYCSWVPSSKYLVEVENSSFSGRVWLALDALNRKREPRDLGIAASQLATRRTLPLGIMPTEHPCGIIDQHAGGSWG